MSESSVWREANALQKNPKVTSRLAELRKPAVEKAQVTLETHLQDLKDLRDKALQAEKYGPAINAEIARGKASGLYVEKMELSGQIDVVNRILEARKRARSA